MKKLFAFTFISCVYAALASFGGWRNVDVGDEKKQFLDTVLANNNYSDDVKSRICVKEILSLEEQTVAGKKYRYHVSGCLLNDQDGSIAKCTEGMCDTFERLKVEIYERPWESFVQIISITTEDGSMSSSNSGSALEQFDELLISEEEKKQIKDWIARNNFNDYGDAKETAYTGGNPLFDESTGTYTEYYKYLLEKFPNHPWRDVKKSVAALPITNLMAAAPVAKTSSPFNEFLAPLVAMLAAGGIVTLVVYQLKRIRSRREYETISGSLE